jgi:lipopolysaccharide biosynthesis regulator YciM
MQIPKEQILEFLRSRGEQDKAGQADQELPDQVDTEQHADVLQRLGIDPQDLLGQLGGLGGKLGL